MILSSSEAAAMAPEMAIMVGILFAILVPNLGDAKARIPLTSFKFPILWGGTRFEITSDPRAPGIISTVSLAVACILSLYAIESSDGKTISGVMEITGFGRFMSMVFTAALAITAAASIYRIPSTKITVDDAKDADERTTLSLMDNRRQVDLHILLMMVALGMSLMALSTNLFLSLIHI